MDQHPHGPLGSPEHAGDLRRAHLVHEAEQQRPPPVVGEAVERRQRRGRLVTHRDAGLEVDGIGDHQPAPRAVSSEAAGRRRRVAALVGDDVARDPEQPDAEGRGVAAVLGRRELAEPRQRGEGAHEHALRRVLRGVVVGELVEGVGIHLGEVLPVQGVELGGVPTRRLDERAVAVERDDASTRRIPPAFRTPDAPSRYTAARASLTRRISPAWTTRSPAGASASSTTSPPEAASTPRAADRARVVVERDQPPGRRLALGPRRRGRSAGRRAANWRRGGRRTRPAAPPVDRPATRRLAQAGHRLRELGREVARPPVRVDPDADDDPRVVRAEALALAEHAGELAGSVEPVRVRSTSITRSFGHLSRMAPTGSPAASSAASAIASATVAASRQARSARARSAGSRATAAGPRPAAPSTSGRAGPDPAVCSSATARQTSASPSASQPRTTSLVEPTRAKCWAWDEHVGCERRTRSRASAGARRRPSRRSRAAPARTRRGARGRPPPRGPRR